MNNEPPFTDSAATRRDAGVARDSATRLGGAPGQRDGATHHHFARKAAAARQDNARKNIVDYVDAPYNESATDASNRISAVWNSVSSVPSRVLDNDTERELQRARLRRSAARRRLKARHAALRGTQRARHLRAAINALRHARHTGSHALLDHSLTSSNVFTTRPESEAQREPAYQDELRVLFDRRLRLLTTIGMMVLPFFALFHAIIARDLVPILLVHAALFTACAATRLIGPRLRDLRSIRRLSLCNYGLFCAAAGLLVTLMSRDQIFLLGGHNHIMLSVLLLPFSVWECAAIGIFAIASLALSGWFGLMPEQSHLYFSHLFVLCTTMLFVLYIAHFQMLTNRRAFDATFDVMRSATKMQTLSFLDALTGGFNRRYLEKILNTEMTRAARFGRPLSFLMFDLDNFKIVNDTLGHAAGDEVLREVWNATNGAIREVDSAARYGGDEFCVVLPEADAEAAFIIAQRLREIVHARLHERFGTQSLEGRVTLSIGLVTTNPKEELPPQTLIERADERLYEAKRSGKNSIATEPITEH